MQVVKHAHGQELLAEIKYVQMLQVQQYMTQLMNVNFLQYQVEHVQ